MRQLLLSLVSCVLILAAGCSKPEPAPTTAAAEASPAPAKTEPAAPIDACSLLKPEEVQQVMGAEVKEATPEQRMEEGFVISQCYYVLPVMTDSVTLRLVQRGTAEDARDPRQVWQETFARDLEKAEKRRRKAPPERVPDLGDEAFWLGGPERGGLYVLKGNVHFRIGFGGEPNQPRKIEKASQLARLILQRL